MSSKKIYVIGSSNTDMVIKTDLLPKPGETKLGGDFFMNAGGKGANQAVAAARLGGEVSIVTKVGKDVFGKQTKIGLENEKINTDNVFTDDILPSGTALIMVESSGENCIAVAPGANARLLKEDIEKVNGLQQASIILMQLETPISTIEYVTSSFSSANCRVIINPAPAQQLLDEVLHNLFLMTPNETEAFVLTGIKANDEGSISKAADVLISKGVQNVIITLGSRGAYFKNEHESFMIPAPEVIAVDTTAAGDTFNGAIAVAIIEGMKWKAAMKFAIMAASISVTRSGAQSSIPYRHELNIHI